MFKKLKDEVAGAVSLSLKTSEHLCEAFRMLQTVSGAVQGAMGLIENQEKRLRSHESAINSYGSNLDRLNRDMEAAKKKLDPASHGPSIYAIIEDLRARMPKGSAVSDYRFDELVGKVARLQRQLDEINAVFQNAKREHEQTLAELEAERRTNVKRVEAKALPA